MGAEMAMATVTKTMMARTITVATMTTMAAAFLPDRQQSTKRGSRRNGDNNGNGNGNGNGNSDGNSNNNNGRGQQR
jgi:hypothetical protein